MKLGMRNMNNWNGQGLVNCIGNGICYGNGVAYNLLLYLAVHMGVQWMVSGRGGKGIMIQLTH